MSYFALSAIDNIPSGDSSLLLAWAEIWALASGRFAIEDLQIDKEVILSDLSAVFPGEDIMDLASEPGIAWDRVLEELERRIIDEADRAVGQLPFQYPFELRPDAGVVLACRDGLTENVFGAIYLSMQVERLYRSGLLFFWDESGGSEMPEQVFLRNYRRLFEVASAVSVAKFKGGVPVLIGESRSVKSSLLPALAEVCELVGSGKPKEYDQLSLLQRQANDGGIDAIVIYRDNNQVHECVMIGATTQQSSIREKVMGQERRSRVNNYLLDHTVLGPQSGMLTHSNPFDEGIYAKCNEVGCGYLAREKILQNLGELQTSSLLQRRSYLRSIRGARDPLNALSKIRFLMEFDLVDLPC